MQLRIYGVICAVAAGSLFTIYLSNSTAYRHGQDDRYILEYAAGFSLMAAGLLAAKVWAELLFDFCLSLTSAGIVVAIVVNPFEIAQTVLDIGVVALLMLPTALTIQRIRRGEYFLREA